MFDYERQDAWPRIAEGLPKTLANVPTLEPFLGFEPVTFLFWWDATTGWKKSQHTPSPSPDWGPDPDGSGDLLTHLTSDTEAAAYLSDYYEVALSATSIHDLRSLFADTANGLSPH